MDKSLDIYSIFIILLFSSVMGVISATSLKHRFHLNNTYRILINITLSLSIGAVVYLGFNAIYETSKKNILDKNEKLLTETDSLVKVINEQKKAYTEKARHIKILNLVQRYFDVYESQDIERFDSLFVFPVRKFFVITNVPKEKVNERIKFAWNHNKSIEFFVTEENTHIDDYIDSAIVFVNLNIEKKEKNVIARIKFDKNFKIFSLNNYIQSEQQTQKILSPKDTVD